MTVGVKLHFLFFKRNHILKYKVKYVNMLMRENIMNEYCNKPRLTILNINKIDEVSHQLQLQVLNTVEPTS